MFGTDLLFPTDTLPVFAVCAVVVLLICWRMGESPYGRVLRGIREDEVACRSLGKNVFAYKLQSLALAAALAAVAGYFLALNVTVIYPVEFESNFTFLGQIGRAHV